MDDRQGQVCEEQQPGRHLESDRDDVVDLEEPAPMFPLRVWCKARTTTKVQDA